MLIIKDGLILSCSRRNSTKFGLPGGKVEDNEHPATTAVRECREEVGVIINDCTHLLTREDASDPVKGPQKAYCYLATSWEGVPTQMEIGITVKWLLASELIDPETGAYPDYNARTIEAFKKRYPSLRLMP